MPAGTFDKSQGLVVALSSNTSFTIHPTNWAWTGIKGTDIDSTTLADTDYTTSDKGLNDPGEVTFDFKAVLSQLPTNWPAIISQSIQNLSLTFVAGGGYSIRRMTFPIYCNAFSMKGEKNDQITGSITFKVTAAPTFTFTA